MQESIIRKIETRQPSAETVFVFRNILEHCQDNPKLTQALQGFDSDLFKSFLEGSYEYGEPILEKQLVPEAEKDAVEIITVFEHILENGLPIEIAEVLGWEGHTMKSRLRRSPEESIGFEAIYVKEGFITYAIPTDIIGDEAQGYQTTGELHEVTLSKGNLLIVPRNVARQITNVPKNKYEYELCWYLHISDPWVDSDLPIDMPFTEADGLT